MRYDIAAGLQRYNLLHTISSCICVPVRCLARHAQVHAKLCAPKEVSPREKVVNPALNVHVKPTSPSIQAGIRVAVLPKPCR